MTIQLGSTAINKLMLGTTEIKKAHLGSTLLYDKTGAGAGGGTGYLDDIAGLDVVFQIDATISASYSGTGQTISNIIASPFGGAAQTELDFFLGSDGTAETSDPTFTGTAGTDSAYFLHDAGGDWFSMKNAAVAGIKDATRSSVVTNGWLAFVYKNTPGGGSVQKTFSNHDGVSLTGFELRQNTNESIFGNLKGTNFRNIVTTPASAVSVAGETLIIFSWQTDGFGSIDGQLYINSDTPTATRTSLYESLTDSTSRVFLGATPNGTQPIDNGARFYGAAFGRGAMTDTKAAAIRAWYQANHEAGRYV